jgi:hypothetical protein
MKILLQIDADSVIAAFNGRAGKLPQTVSDAVAKLTRKLAIGVRQAAPSKTGELRAAIKDRVESNALQAQGTVFVEPDVPYAFIQEFGGVTPPHDIYPTKVKALSFLVGSQRVFAAHVSHPGSQIQGKFYLHGTFEKMKDDIGQQIEAAVRESLK